MQLGKEIERRIPKGWSWSLYCSSENDRARAVLVSLDYRIHIGREGDDIDVALQIAILAAKNGERE